MIIYGIKNCDTCRKARRWLVESGRAHTWRDLREDGPDALTLRQWIERVGVDRLVNRRSTTWRGLGESDRIRASDPDGAASLLAEHPTLIKRPVFELGDRVLVGFDDSVKQAL